MEREMDDVNGELTPDEINELEQERIDKLNKAGIDEQNVLDRAQKNGNAWNSYFGENITRGKDDVNFCVRDQWTAVERSEFTRLFKPAMTANKLYDSTKKVVGEQRKNKPDLMVRSLTGRATQDQITLRSDLVRSISYSSQTDLVYQTAFKSALLLSFGAFQVCLDYESPTSFNKIIRYDIITDPTACAWDPTALKPHKGDGNYCSRNFVLTRDEFFASYPFVTNPLSWMDPNMLLDFQWQTRDTIILHDEYVKEWFPLMVYKVRIGNEIVNVTEEQFERLMEEYKISLEIIGTSESRSIIEKNKPIKIDHRQTKDYRIMHYRMLRDQIVEFNQWPSRQLPIPFVDGDSSYIEGRQYTKSFIREARDSQKLHNYSISEIAAELKNRRREQWVGTPDNIAGFEQEWRNPELQIAMLRARPDPKTGQMPQKMPAWEVSQGLFATLQSSNQSLREVMGFSEAEELQGRDISGRARKERKLEGSMSAYVFFDNLNQAIEQGGRIVLDLLPHIVGDEERHMIITKRDGNSQSIILNEIQENGQIKNEISGFGEYDIEIDTGPSFAVQKEVALEFMQQTIAAFPGVFPLIADLWASNLDIEQMPTMKDRLKSLVPPDIIAKEEGKPAPPKQPDPQAMMMQAEMELKKSQIEQKKAEVSIKAKQLEIEKEQAELDKAEMILKAQKMQMDAELNVYDHQANLEKARVTHSLDRTKAENDHLHKMASILSDIYKHNNPHEKKVA